MIKSYRLINIKYGAGETEYDSTRRHVGHIQSPDFLLLAVDYGRFVPGEDAKFDGDEK